MLPQNSSGINSSKDSSHFKPLFISWILKTNTYLLQNGFILLKKVPDFNRDTKLLI